jgi:hypothetical protein
VKEKPLNPRTPLNLGDEVKYNDNKFIEIKIIREKPDE